jgi:hypothetical protein
MLTSYAKSKNNKDEELAEIVSLYLRNPYLLKLISEKHYEFVSRFFNPPIKSDEDTFLTIYETYSPRYRKSLEKKYGFSVWGDRVVKKTCN